MASRHEAGIVPAMTERSISRPSVFLIRMLLFLVIVGMVGAVFYEPILRAFTANILLNGFIAAVLLVGTAYAFRQVLRLFGEISWVDGFRNGDTAVMLGRQPTLLAPMANLLRDQRGHVVLPASVTKTIMDSIGSRLDEARETTRYLVGLLVFLGLLGTFWGLLSTINAIGNTIGSLDVGAGDSGVIFEELKTGLEAPLAGMGIAFSSSLFGLAGSLILGFLDLQAGQAQNRFYNELEEWLSELTQIEGTSSSSAPVDVMQAQLRIATSEMQRTLYEFNEQFRLNLTSAQDGGSDEAVKELARGIEKLVRQMRAEQKVVREWVDEQAAQQAELAQVLRQINTQLRGGR